MTGKFIPTPAAIKELALTPEMVATMKEGADAVAEKAKDTAPVVTGRYRDSIEAVVGIENATATWRVNANAWYSGFVEFGTVKLSARHVLSRAAEALGLRVSVGRER